MPLRKDNHHELIGCTCAKCTSAMRRCLKMHQIWCSIFDNAILPGLISLGHSTPRIFFVILLFQVNWSQDPALVSCFVQNILSQLNRELVWSFMWKICVHCWTHQVCELCELVMPWWISNLQKSDQCVPCHQDNYRSNSIWVDGHKCSKVSVVVFLQRFQKRQNAFSGCHKYNATVPADIDHKLWVLKWLSAGPCFTKFTLFTCTADADNQTCEEQLVLSPGNKTGIMTSCLSFVLLALYELYDSFACVFKV